VVADFLAKRPAKTPFFYWFGSLDPHRLYTSVSGRKAGKNPTSLRAKKSGNGRSF